MSAAYLVCARLALQDQQPLFEQACIGGDESSGGHQVA
jgi:hypothetical protein